MYQIEQFRWAKYIYIHTLYKIIFENYITSRKVFGGYVKSLFITELQRKDKIEDNRHRDCVNIPTFTSDVFSRLLRKLRGKLKNELNQVEFVSRNIGDRRNNSAGRKVVYKQKTRESACCSKPVHFLLRSES